MGMFDGTSLLAVWFCSASNADHAAFTGLFSLRRLYDADVWFVYENWRSPEGFDAHMLSEHLQAFLKATPDLVAGNIDLRRFRMISSPATRRI
jgi:quinol monooxygenase YgiN